MQRKVNDYEAEVKSEHLKNLCHFIQDLEQRLQTLTEPFATYAISAFFYFAAAAAKEEKN